MALSPLAPLAPLDELRAFLATAHNPALTADSMVFQVWNDGEVTCQKAGDLLWQRNLHTTYPPLRFGLSVEMPERWRDGHSYAFVTYNDALRVRALMCRVAGKPDPCHAEQEVADMARAIADGRADDPRLLVERVAASNRRIAEALGPAGSRARDEPSRAHACGGAGPR